MADVFGITQTPVSIPLTADRASINWSGLMADANQLNISATRPITYRRVIGNTAALIIPGQPQGSITIARLIFDSGANSVFARAGWNACSPATITLSATSCTGAAPLSLTATGCVVVQYGAAVEAEGLTVLDNVAIQFLQLLNQ